MTITFAPRTTLVLIGALVVGIVLAGLAGCSTLGFYQQAVVGQLRLLNAREDVDELLAGTAISDELRAALVDSQAVLAFAGSQLGLSANGRYSDYVALEHPYVVWNLVVAPVDSVAPRTWCFPVAGCVSYRGYFDKARAESNAAKVDAEQFDTFIGGVPAYSTLGWFDDPLLSSFIEWPRPARAELLFHELAHGRLYVAGDTPFNESFATFVANYALPLYLQQAPQQGRENLTDALDLHRTRKAERERFRTLQLKLRARLEADFAQLPAELSSNRRLETAREIRKRRYAQAAACFARVQKEFTNPSRLLAILQAPPNLAQLSLVSAYNGWLGAFSALFDEAGQDLERFFVAAEALTDLSFEARQVELEQLAERHSQQQIQSDRDHQYPANIQCEALANHSTDGHVAG